MLPSRYGNCDIAVELVKSGGNLDLQNKVRGASVFVFTTFGEGYRTWSMCVGLSNFLQLFWHYGLLGSL